MNSSKGRDKPVRIGKYRVISHLVSGGMGVVYKAYDEELDRVVLKILARDLSNSRLAWSAFGREARHAGVSITKTSSPYTNSASSKICSIWALEFVDGVDLLQYISQKIRLDVTEAQNIATQAASALEHSFEQGIIHRDVKPSNLLIARRDQLLVKLIDSAREVADDAVRMTGAGLIVGTIDYLAPEQARDSGTADIRSDLYSLGCTFYEMLSGQPPFRGSVTELVYKHAEESPPDICVSRPEVSPRLSYIIRKMMAKKPADRYQTPSELLVDLRRVDGPEPAPVQKSAEVPQTPAASANSLQEMIRRRSQTELTRRKGTDDLTSTDRDRADSEPDVPAIPDSSWPVRKSERGDFQRQLRLWCTALAELLCARSSKLMRYRQKTFAKRESPLMRVTFDSTLSATVVDWILKARIKAAFHTRGFGKVFEMCEQLVHELPGFFCTVRRGHGSKRTRPVEFCGLDAGEAQKQTPKSKQGANSHAFSNT